MDAAAVTLALAADLYRAKDYASARAVLEGMTEADPSDLVAHFNAGQACVELGDYAGAVDHFGPVALARRGGAKAWVKLGSAALLNQQHLLARYALFEALMVDNTDADAWHAFASLLATEMRDEEAIAYYQHAQLLRPNFADAQVGEAFCHLRLGNYPRGWQLFEKRWDLPAAGRGYHGIPEWKGERCGTIILRSEMGFGELDPVPPLRAAGCRACFRRGGGLPPSDAPAGRVRPRGVPGDRHRQRAVRGRGANQPDVDSLYLRDHAGDDSPAGAVRVPTVVAVA